MSRGKCHNGRNYLFMAVLSELFKFSTVLLLLFNILYLNSVLFPTLTHPEKKKITGGKFLMSLRLGDSRCLRCPGHWVCSTAHLRGTVQLCEPPSERQPQQTRF